MQAIRLHGPTILPPTRRQTIMLVHERSIVRSTFAAELRSLGFDVVEATNGLHALRQATRPPYVHIDGLIIDASSPVVAGPAVAGRLQEMYPGLLTLLLGADATPANLANMHTACLPRPFSRVGFLSAVHALLA